MDASDDKTVDQYDAALSSYIDTEDDSSLRGLAPMIAEDSLALALQEGDMTPEEAANGDLAKALGFEPGEALQAAVTPTDQPVNEQPQSQPGQWQWRQSEATPQIGEAPPARNASNTSQVSLGGGATGMVAPKAAQLWAMDAAAREAVQAEGGQGV